MEEATAVDAAEEAAVVVEVVKVAETNHEHTEERPMTPHSIAKTRRSIARRTGGATISLPIAQDKHRGTTTRPRGKIAWEVRMLSVSPLSDGGRRHYLLGKIIK